MEKLFLEQVQGIGPDSLFGGFSISSTCIVFTIVATIIISLAYVYGISDSVEMYSFYSFLLYSTLLFSILFHLNWNRWSSEHPFQLNPLLEKSQNQCSLRNCKLVNVDQNIIENMKLISQ